MFQHWPAGGTEVRRIQPQVATKYLRRLHVNPSLSCWNSQQRNKSDGRFNRNGDYQIKALVRAAISSIISTYRSATTTRSDVTKECDCHFSFPVRKIHLL